MRAPDSGPFSALEKLATCPWHMGVPSLIGEAPEDPAENLPNLEKIVTLVKAALANQASQEKVVSLTYRCWRFAVTSDPEIQEKAFQICRTVFPSVETPSDGWKVQIGQKSFPLSDTLSRFLEQESPYFAAHFNGQFREKLVRTIELKEINPDYFQKMLEIMEKGSQALSNLNLELSDFIDFLNQAGRLNMRTIPFVLGQIMEPEIGKFKRDEANFQMAAAIQSKLDNYEYATLSALNKFFIEYITPYRRSPEDLLACVNSQGLEGKKKGYFLHFLDLSPIQLPDKRILFQDVPEEQIIEILAACPNLTILVMNQPITDKTIAFIAEHCPLLRTLDLSNVQFSDASVRNLTKLRHLETLLIAGGDELTDTAAKTLASITSLRSLSIFNYTQMTDKGAEDLSRLTELRTLELHACQLSEEAIKRLLDQLKHLEQLSLNDIQNVTNNVVLAITALKRLRVLSLWGCRKITDEAVKHIAEHLPKLRKLLLSLCPQLTDCAASHLTTLTHLQKLHLKSSQLTDNGVRHIATLKNLEVLDLSSNKQLTDEAVVTLASLPLLIKLSMNSCLLTDRAAQSIAQSSGFQNLREVNFEACPAMTPQAATYLENRRLQGLTVTGRSFPPVHSFTRSEKLFRLAFCVSMVVLGLFILSGIAKRPAP